MSIRGPDALASLDEAMRDIRREEEDISRRLARSAEKVGKIREHEAELFRQLAQVRLDPSAHTELDGRIAAAEGKARDMLKAHAQLLTKAEQDAAGLDQTLARLVGERAEVLKLFEVKQSELKALAARLGPSIARDPGFAAKREAAARLASIAAQSMRKTEQAETDRESKGRSFRADPLFMYLWEAGFGTASYRRNNLVRFLDSKVAEVIGFTKARTNFALLNEIPLRLREHAEQQLENARRAELEVDDLETAAIDLAGGKPMREAMAEVQARINALDGEIMNCEDQRDEAATTVGKLAQGRDPAFEGALQELAAALGHGDIHALLAQARLNHGQSDMLVAQIDDARARSREEEAETRELRERLKTLAMRRRDLEDIQWEFKKHRFDDPRSTFRDDTLVGDMLNDFLRGRITAAHYWEQWRRLQNWIAGTSDWGGGVGLPGNGRQRISASPQYNGDLVPTRARGSVGGNWGGGAGSGFTRPRTSSAGTRKHGGFKTGDGL